MEYYGLDIRECAILDSYRENRDVYEKLEKIVKETLQKAISDKGLYVTR